MFAVQFLSEAGPNTELVWFLWALLGFVFLMVAVGWLTSLKNGGKPAARHEAVKPSSKTEEPRSRKSKSQRIVRKK